MNAEILKTGRVSGRRKRKGSENLAISGETAVDQANLGQFPRPEPVGATKGASCHAELSAVVMSWALCQTATIQTVFFSTR